MNRFITLLLLLVASAVRGEVVGRDSLSVDSAEIVFENEVVDSVAFTEDVVVFASQNVPLSLARDSVFTDDFRRRYGDLTIYDYPYSRSLSMPDWKRLWINTGVLVGAGITTMLVLEALPKDATAWNMEQNEKIPLFKRWVSNVKAGPVWDKDNPVFNYMLHPYAGAAYYMGARSCGFNCWGSFLYSFCISTFFWEYGFEAFNEIPSVQDLVITPVVGSLLGEGFYLLKRKIVNDDYRLWGSRVLGYSVAFIVDPINEVLGYFRGAQRKQCRRSQKLDQLAGSSWIAPSGNGLQGGFTITYNF